MDESFLFDNDMGTLLPHQDAISRRLKQGKCLTCPNILFEIKNRNIPFKKIKKTPLTISGHVLEGRCLDCHPLTVEIVPGGNIERNERPDKKNSHCELLGEKRKEDHYRKRVLDAKLICETILRLAISNDHERNMAEKMAGGGEIMAIHQVMSGNDEFIMNQDLQEKATEALDALLSILDDHDIQKFPIVNTITCIMVTFPNSILIQENAFSILTKLCERNDNYTKNIVDCGGVDIVLSMLNKYSSSKKLKANGHLLLSKLSSFYTIY
mmetsp:Transcript_24558/g.29639  ORF Transcript_24558/g.29639 Transcript_24558/m.29639 type:complete len:268 (+) Transcript_24558:1-804(+)